MSLIGKNYSDWGIERRLKLQPHVVRYYKQRAYSSYTETLRELTPEKALIDYAIAIQSYVAELDQVLRTIHRSGKAHTATVKAIRLKYRLENDVVGMAKKLGLLPKRAISVEVGNIVFEKRSMKRIRRAVESL